MNYAENYKKYENSNAKHHPKLVTLDDLHDFFKSLASQDEAKITYVVAAIFCAATGLRIDSVVNVKWSYFNSDFSKMLYPKTKLKGERETEERREDLLLPLPPLLQEILKKYKTTINPFAAYQRSSEYVFCGLRGKISVDGLRKFVKEVSNYKITPHGLRGTLATWAKKRLEHQVPLFYVKMYLHQKPARDEIEAAYTEISYRDAEAQEQLAKLGRWYSEFLREQYDFVKPVLEKLY
ncbi:tyrosine-type recombinase/integrase [Campylobacter showae]|uniref:tyrosine-type recombinase/integrase n=1 Tax=Campylobacter showae TaxID=204 RepID=UPI003C6EB9D8